MELIEMLRNIVIREGFAAGRSLREVSDETGLSVLEVLQRESQGLAKGPLSADANTSQKKR